jgi:hypothetical protein
MTRILVTVLGIALFGLYSAKADTSDPTRGFRETNMDNRSTNPVYRDLPAPAASTDWSGPQTWIYSPGVTTPAKELVEQIKRNEAARGRYDDYGNAPFEYSAPFVRAFQQGGSGE